MCIHCKAVPWTYSKVFLSLGRQLGIIHHHRALKLIGERDVSHDGLEGRGARSEQSGCLVIGQRSVRGRKVSIQVLQNPLLYAV